MRLGYLPRPFSLALVIAASVVVAAFLAVSPTPAYAITNCSVSNLTIDSEEQAFLTLLNNYRQANGKAKLTISTNLNRAASWMSADMANKNYFSHTDSAGRNPSTRVLQCGFPGGAGENIAAGTYRDTAQEVFDAWKASSGHNTNMLNSSYKQIGIARHYNSMSQYKWYWTTDFSLVSDGTNALGGSTTPAPPTQTASSITNPTPGSQLGNTATFNWSAASGASQYRLYVGTTPGSSNLKSLTTTSRSSTVTNLAPTTGSRTVYVRLGTRFGTSSTWYYRDYVYTARR